MHALYTACVFSVSGFVRFLWAKQDKQKSLKSLAWIFYVKPSFTFEGITFKPRCLSSKNEYIVSNLLQFCQLVCRFQENLVLRIQVCFWLVVQLNEFNGHLWGTKRTGSRGRGFWYYLFKAIMVPNIKKQQLTVFLKLYSDVTPFLKHNYLSIFLKLEDEDNYDHLFIPYFATAEIVVQCIKLNYTFCKLVAHFLWRKLESMLT